MHCAVRGVFVDCAELSDPGHEPTKQINEDTCAFAQTSHGLLSVVCDGMGGHSAGREASSTAMRTIVEHMSLASDTEPAHALSAAIQHAARDVYAVGGDVPAEVRPGSTCVALLLHDGWTEVAHVGDSRAYLYRGGALTRLTRDHSMVQQMLDHGMITAEEAIEHPDANKITRALGMLETVEVELRPEPLRLVTGDVLLLCTDGLTDLVSDGDMTMLIGSHADKGPEHLCKTLVGVALARGGWDNVTVQVLIVRELSKAQGATVVLESTEGRGNTVVDGPAGGARGAGPTLMEEPAPERTTLPGGPGSPLTPFREDSPTNGVQRRGAGPARAVVWSAAAVTAVIVLGVLGWALARKLRAPEPEPVPPPPPPVETSAAKTPTIAPPTELSASPEPPPPLPEAGPDADAALP